MESLSRCLLLALEAYGAEHAAGPTVSELAGDLGITPGFGHKHLVELLQREVALGRVSDHGTRFQLTAAGRAALHDAVQAPPAPKSFAPTLTRP